MSFNKEETTNLVKTYCDFDWQKKFTNIKKCHRSVWIELADYLKNEFGMNKSGDQCKNKIKNLKKEFFRIKRLPFGSGNDSWDYFNDFSKVFGKSALADPIILVDSLDEHEFEISLDDENASIKQSSDNFDPLFEDDINISLNSPSSSSTCSSTSTSNCSTPALKSAIGQAKKRKTPASQIYEFLKNCEESDKLNQIESKKNDEKLLNYVGEISETLKTLVEIKKQKLESNTMYSFNPGFFQVPPNKPKLTKKKKS